MTKFIKAILIASLLISASAQAVTVRGWGASALRGGDLTDPVAFNPSLGEGSQTYTATFSSSVKPGFEGWENAFNVFDNKVGGGNDKWCCDMNVWVQADFGATRYNLSAFTATSGNDEGQRDSDQWQILGSNDGVNFTPIFIYDVAGVSPWSWNRHQVNEYKVGEDFAAPAAYSIFRYQSTSILWGNMHQLNELEFFGTVAAPATDVPEPAMPALLGLGLAALALARRKKQA